MISPTNRIARRGLPMTGLAKTGLAMSWIDQPPDGIDAGPFPAVAPESVATVEPRAFREGMSRLGAAVHVVTTDGPGGKAGFTATAVCSVSDAPPMLLVCLNRKSSSGPVLQGNGVFCVNTLSRDAEDLADVFAGRTGAVKDARFVTGTWSTLKTGAPVLDSAVVAFECRVVDLRTVGSHNVIFGAVVDIRVNDIDPALIYHQRVYKSV
jgi:flavin reductase (DIM6/NTAB) family NADH-FMN oxidoreductase RutF